MNGYLLFRNLLPAVCDDAKAVLNPSAAQIQHKPVLSHHIHHPLQPVIMYLPSLKHIGCDDHMGSACIQEFHRIIRRNPASHLHPARIGFYSFQRLCLCCFIIPAIPGIQQNNMSAQNPCIPIKLCIISCILPGHKIFKSLISLIPQAPSHNLFHFTIMNIYAWSEFHFDTPTPALSSVSILCFLTIYS